MNRENRIMLIGNKVYINDKVTGEIRHYSDSDKAKTYFTTRDPKRHFMKKFNGYGISKGVLDILFQESVEFIVLRTPEAIFKFKLSSYINTDLRYNYNGDEQYFVPIPENKKINTLEKWS